MAHHDPATWTKRDRVDYVRESQRLVALLTKATKAIADGLDASAEVAAAVKAADRFQDAWTECPCVICQATDLEQSLQASVKGAA